MMKRYRSVEWVDGALRVLDQRLLPAVCDYLDYSDYREVAAAIRKMVVRGAPAIGVAAAYGMVLAARESRAMSLAELKNELNKAAELLQAARPTAVNLFWAIDRMLKRVQQAGGESPGILKDALLQEAHAIYEEDIWVNKQIGLHGLELVSQDAVFIHHCNTGALATVDYGTALGIIRTAHEHGHKVFVYVDETRPRLQGARLTTWELQQLGIPHQLIVDGASGFVMASRRVDLATVGCDRVAANGDTANKIGTYNLAIVAKAHGVPFYVAAPTSTIDLPLKTGAEIGIEMRAAQEITCIGSEPIAPEGTEVLNPAFDVTPPEYITAFITEGGIAYPPFAESLPIVVQKASDVIRQMRKGSL
jgi:methylthioribose-1-phosphate isomerase